MKSIYRGGLPLLIAMLLVTPKISEAVGFGVLDQTGCSICCPECKHTCNLKAEQVEETKKGFDVESKVICIPRVVFPWQKAKKSQCASCDSCDGRGCTACIHNGARTRKICVLKNESYKCPKCEYTWSAEPKGCSTMGCATMNYDYAADEEESSEKFPFSPLQLVKFPGN